MPHRHDSDTLHLDGPGASYVRVSDDKQDTQRQYDAIAAFLERHGVKIPPHLRFADEGWARDTAPDRPNFQRLLQLAEQGAVKWIVVSERDRFGTADADEFVHYRYLLRQWQCKLYDAAGTDWTRKDIATVITAVVEGEKSAQEQRSISKRVLGGMVAIARAGEWTGGAPKLGFDVGCFERSTGKEVWRVVWEGRDVVRREQRKGKSRPVYFTRRKRVYQGGREERLDGEVSAFNTSPGTHWLHLVPSKDKTKLAAVRKLFQRYASESVSYTELARWLNRLQIRTAHGGLFQAQNIIEMLPDESYLGYPTFNKRRQGKFHGLLGGEITEVLPGRGGKVTISSPADIIRARNRLYAPLVDAQTWTAVQEKLAARDKITHAPRNPQLYLAGLVVCAGCGAKMMCHGAGMEYYCGTWGKHRTYGTLADCPCERNAVKHALLEEYLAPYLAEVEKRLHLLTAGKTEADLLGRLEGQEDAAWQGYRDGFSRLTAYLAQYHPHEYDRLLRDAAAEQGEQEAAARQRETAGAGRDPQRTAGELAAYLEAKGFKDSDLVRIAASPGPDSLDAPPDYVAVAVDLYRSLFDPARMKEDIDRLQAEYDSMLDGWRDLPTPAAKARAGEKLAAVEARLADLKQQSADASAVVEEQWRAIRDLQKKVAAARAELHGEDNAAACLRKAEVYRGILSRIECEFVPTGKTGRGGPGLAKSRLIALDFQPLEGPAKRLEIKDNGNVGVHHLGVSR
jgi:DNA invertase Pin-like site-specific DNA recombinase